MSRIVIPTVTDWRHSADFTSGTVLVDGRLAEMLYPELWTGCVGAWSPALDPHPWDHSGEGNPGTRVGGVTDVDGSWNLASASSQRISVDDRDNLDFGTSQLFSGSGWVNTTNGSTWSLMGKVNHDVAGAANRGFSFNYISSINALRMSWFSAAGQNTTYDGTTNVADGTWRHVGFTVSSRNATPGAEDAEVYVGGVAEGTLNISDAGTNINVTNAIALTLGTRQVSGSLTSFFNGQLSGVMLHRRALSAPEMRLLASERDLPYKCRLHPRRYFVR